MKEKFKTECLQCHRKVYWEGEEFADDQNRLMSCSLCGVQSFDFYCEACDNVNTVRYQADQTIPCPECSAIYTIPEEQLSKVYILHPIENLSEAERKNYVPFKEALPVYVICLVVIVGFLYFLLQRFVIK